MFEFVNQILILFKIELEVVVIGGRGVITN